MNNIIYRLKELADNYDKMVIELDKNELTPELRTYSRKLKKDILTEMLSLIRSIPTCVQ